MLSKRGIQTQIQTQFCILKEIHSNLYGGRFCFENILNYMADSGSVTKLLNIQAFLAAGSGQVIIWDSSD